VPQAVEQEALSSKVQTPAPSKKKKKKGEKQGEKPSTWGTSGELLAQPNLHSFTYLPYKDSA
jgi:hypothetical protein